jgi:hypothetical protein
LSNDIVIGRCATEQRLAERRATSGARLKPDVRHRSDAMSELNRRRTWALGFVVAAIVVANTFLYVDGTQPLVMLLGFVLGAVTVFGGFWATLKWHALRCPHCSERFSPLLPTKLHPFGHNPWSSRCANCGRAYTDA